MITQKIYKHTKMYTVDDQSRLKKFTLRAFNVYKVEP